MSINNMVFDIFTIQTFVEALWLILPAYAANGLVPIARGKHPIDGGRKFIDGKYWFGPGKTWEGLILGSIIGIVIAFIQLSAFPYLPWELSEIPLIIVPMSLTLGFLLGFGTIIGDMCGSFIKRRFNLKRGKAAPGLDQLDFLIGAFVFASLVVAVQINWFILMLVLTFVFHVTASRIGYWAKVKKEPY